MIRRQLTDLCGDKLDAKGSILGIQMFNRSGVYSHPVQHNLCPLYTSGVQSLSVADRRRTSKLTSG